MRVASERVESPKGTLYYRGSSSLLGAQKIKSSFGGAKRIPSVELNFSPVPDVENAAAIPIFKPLIAKSCIYTIIIT